MSQVLKPRLPRYGRGSIVATASLVLATSLPVVAELAVAPPAAAAVTSIGRAACHSCDGRSARFLGDASALPTPTAVGVYIDHGDYATGSPSVELDLVWPAGATSALVSNDATFDAAGATQTIPVTATVPWTLPQAPLGGPPTAGGLPTAGGPPTAGGLPTSSGLPTSVYVEFLGAGISPVIVSGRIVLDETVPTISDAEVLQVAHVPRRPVKFRYRVRVVAADTVSGIAAVETSPKPYGGVVTTVSPAQRRGFVQLHSVIAPISSVPPRFARVQSVAGVWSPWVPTTPQLSAVRHPHGGTFAVGPARVPFQMRGFDYQPVTSYRVGGRVQYRNDTFAPRFYNRVQVARTLKQMEALRYNSVRVFIDQNSVGNPKGPGLDPAYVSNLAGYIRLAQQDGIRVLLVTGQLPGAGGYSPRIDPRFGIWNSYFLDPADVQAMRRYVSTLITDLQSGGAPLSDVLWELVGEQDWKNTSAPLSWKSGSVRTADGRTYSMAVPASRIAMENDNLLYWTNILSAEIHRMLPGSLVGLGFYAPSINLKRPGWTVRPQVVFAGAARNDFVDVHAYSNLGSLTEQIDSFDAGTTDKAVIMAEFGAARSSFSTPGTAAQGVVQWQELTCRLGGLSLSGWLLWTWNSSAQREYWTALDGGGQIERALAPRARPNPCK